VSARRGEEKNKEPARWLRPLFVAVAVVGPKVREGLLVLRALKVVSQCLSLFSLRSLQLLMLVWLQ
jgi:hypothetical protein